MHNLAWRKIFWKVRVALWEFRWIFPSSITLLRLFLFLPLTGVFISRGDVMPGLLVYIGGALTDRLDGWLAQKLQAVTNFGKLIDPFVDKVYFVGALGFLVIPWHIFAVLIPLIAQECVLFTIGITAGVLTCLDGESRRIQLGANQWGKRKFPTEITLVGLLFLRQFYWARETVSLFIVMDGAIITAAMCANIAAALSIWNHWKRSGPPDS